jgi:hypothetical protein
MIRIVRTFNLVERGGIIGEQLVLETVIPDRSLGTFEGEQIVAKVLDDMTHIAKRHAGWAKADADLAALEKILD